MNESSIFFILWKEIACRIKEQKIITAFWLYSASRLQEVSESHAANVAGLPKVIFWGEDRHSNNWHLLRGDDITVDMLQKFIMALLLLPDLESMMKT